MRAYGQDSLDFNNFRAKFNPVTLPYCVQYSEQDIGLIHIGDLEYKDDKDNNYKPDSLILTSEEIQTFLLSHSDTVHIQNIWKLDTVQTALLDDFLREHTFYANHIFMDSSGYIGLSYEILNHFEGSEKYFCTFNHEGVLISQIHAGFYTHAGSFTNEDGGRDPWYASHGSCIESGGIITKYDYIGTVNGQYEALMQYELLPDGKILKAK